jgi:hypothetical protein
MSRKILLSVVVFAIVSTSYASVIGNWENMPTSGDGWFDWTDGNSGSGVPIETLPNLYSANTSWSTLGYKSLQLTHSGWRQSLSIKLQYNGLVADFLANKRLEFDMAFPADTCGIGGWSKLENVTLNAQGWGWQPLPNSTYTFGYYAGCPMRVIHFIIDYSAALPLIPPNPTYVELIFTTNNDGVHRTFYFDNVRFTTFIATYTINTDANRTPISPYIYGTNSGYPGLTNPGNDSNYTIVRYGGNRLTAYNWENNWSNAGADWWWENDTYLTSWIPSPVAGKAVTDFVDTCIANKLDSIVTLQMAGYVSDSIFAQVDCNIYAAPSKYFKKLIFAKGAPFCNPPGSPDTNDDNVYMDEFVNFLVSRYGHAGEPNGIKFYDLDNEPDLWYDTGSPPHGTHWEVHPYDPCCVELKDKTVALATAVKNVDPNAQILGPVSYGFYGYLTFQGASDWPGLQINNYDPNWFLSYYLDNMKASSVAAGKRLLDVLDLHWYPSALDGNMTALDGNVITNVPSAYSRANCTARMQAPRSLWDYDYQEVSWIEKWYSQWLPILPPIQKSINTYYPDTNLAITEYDYGGRNHWSGGIATADVLGIFGKYGVYIATHFFDGNYVDSAIKIYTNYDGAHSRFGDTEVYSTTSDKVNSPIYASVFNANNSQLHLIVINRNLDNPICGTFNITSTQNFGSGRVWKFDSNDPNIKETTSINGITGNSFTYTIPNLTVCHIVLQACPPLWDLNPDCHINLEDLAIFVRSWPAPYNFRDFASFAQLWGW